MDNFIDGLAEVFETPGNLRAFLRAKLRKTLSKITAETLPMGEISAAVDSAAEAQGWRRPLIEKARAEFPERPDFQAVCDQELANLPAPVPPQPLDRRRVAINAALLGAFLLALAAWVGIGWGIVWFVSTLGTAVGSVIVSGIGTWFDKPRLLRTATQRFSQWLGAPRIRATLVALLVLGAIGSLFFSFIRVVSPPQHAQKLRFHRPSDQAVVFAMESGERRTVPILPWGRALTVDADGYRPESIRLCPWRRLDCTDVMLQPLIYVVIQADDDLEDVLEKDDGPKDRLRIVRDGTPPVTLHDAEYVGGPLLLGTAGQAHLPEFPDDVQVQIAHSEEMDKRVWWLSTGDALTIEIRRPSGRVLAGPTGYTVQSASGWSKVQELRISKNRP